ncbi:hypothetical protein QNJ39_06855 [Macrococcus caseolyticus]|uniref:hypothetical protein n=1 Tax=Macrococcoides caseolyticum TaxID=69966 RepID=UPI0024BC0994|nr:hypothetical protein [Macrococcus caseolyticus]MDJ1091314.1 hypothetical protein [Macrococcus caseolyticus]MDJ1153927.1 hypothetical protein [Macrococcus caseolyticus]
MKIILFTNPLDTVQEFIADKEAQLQHMIDMLTTIILLGFGSVMIILGFTLYLIYKIYRQTSKHYVDGIKAEVEKELVQKYNLELKEEYKSYLQKRVD